MPEAPTLEQYYASQLKQLPLYQQWARLIQREMPLLMPESKRVEVDCVGCGSKKFSLAFRKLDFSYQRCTNCQSLFVSPRPTEAMLERFYTRSQAMRFWKNHIVSAPTTKSYREVSPTTHWIGSIIRSSFSQKTLTAFDYQPCTTTVWDTESITRCDVRLTLVEPILFSRLPKNARARLKIAKSIQAVRGKANILTSFGTLERMQNPSRTIKLLKSKCRRGGLLLLSTNTASGFEFQALGQHSYRIVPPYRLNLLSIEAVRLLLERAGFRILNLATPGKLDVAITGSVLKKKRLEGINEFFRSLFSASDPQTLEALQDFLQLTNRSATLRIVAQLI